MGFGVSLLNFKPRISNAVLGPLLQAYVTAGLRSAPLFKGRSYSALSKCFSELFCIFLKGYIKGEGGRAVGDESFMSVVLPWRMCR